MKRKLRKLCVYVLFLTISLTQVYTNTYASEHLQFPPSSYLAVEQIWQQQNIKDVDDFESEIKASQMKSQSQMETTDNQESVLKLSKGGTSTFEIETKQAGLYTIDIHYYRLSQGLIPLQYKLQINNEYQYDEMTRLLLPIYWQNEKTEFEKDRKGNDVFPSQKAIDQWQSTSLQDTTSRHSQPLKVYLKAGKNKLRLEMLSGEIWLSQVNVHSIEKIKTYSDYSQNFKTEKNKALYIIEAEKTLYKNKTTSYPAISRDLEVLPYDTYQNLYNTYVSEHIGDQVTYQFHIEKDGYYQIGFKINQNVNNAFIYRNIYIDQSIPFQECESYGIDQSDGWETTVLQNKNDEPFQFYWLYNLTGGFK